MSTSDFSDSDLDEDVIDKNFTKAADHIQCIHSSQNQNDLLELYALYKQATSGRCNIPKPNIFNMQNRAKWTSWNDLGDMSRHDAKRLYVEKVNKLDPNWQVAHNKGEKFRSSNSWVVHSTHQPPDEGMERKADHEKNPFDFVKEGNLLRLQESLIVEHMHQLDEYGMGLIHWATDRNAAEILKHLIAVGVDVNLRDSEQQTALHYAASCGHVECVRILLNANADLAVKDADGQTCVDVAENMDIHALLHQ